MGQEIERKFLVDATKLPTLFKGTSDDIEQFYLARDPWVRVRILNHSGARLTIKGPGNLSRAEFEYAIPVEDAEAMRPMGKGSLTKTRHYWPTSNDRTWEIDEFTSPFQLWMAEIELDSPDEAIIDRPVWLGKEVTDDFRYSNAVLVELGAPTPCDLGPIFDLVRQHARRLPGYDHDHEGLARNILTFLRQVGPDYFPEVPFHVGISDFQRMGKLEQEAVVREALR